MKGMNPLTREETDRVTAYLAGSRRDLAIWQIGITSGLRIGEILSLQVGDVVPDGSIADQVYIRRQNMKGKTEGRAVLLHPCAKIAIKGWLDELAETVPLEPDLFLFKSRKGQNRPISCRQALNILQDAFKAVGLTGKKYGSHTMRKTFAMWMYDRLGKDIRKLQLALAHRWVTSTQNYLVVEQSEIDQAVLSLYKNESKAA